jgi:4-hydroxy-2-oxoheptanedioate aldolase
MELDSQPPYNRICIADFFQILVPLIRTVEQVKGVVASAKFPPEGQRGFGSPFSMQNFDPLPSMTEYLQQANDSLLTMVQIETKEALEVVDEIAPLVDVLFVGPFDLGNNIGHPVVDGVIAPELSDAIAKVLAAAKKVDKRAGIYCTSGEQAKHFADMGFHMIHVATDITALQAVMADTLAIAKGEAKPAAAGSY